MNLVVLTAEGELYNGVVKSVKVPGTDGQFEVLNNHAPMVASLGKGDVRIIDKDGKKQHISIEKGFLEVLRNEVALLVQGVAKA
ncbi:MAG: ATP synthase F1 subunit epsilon [Saprospiraceae bacterium]|nr:ATP synthase F1 subunit epsilon [Saprospiraceae bacterium]